MLSVELLELTLAEANAAANAGDAEQAIALAAEVRDAAARHNWAALQGRALLTLAHCQLRVAGRMRQAFDDAQRAAFLCEQTGDVAGESAAHGTMAVAGSFLAQYEDAVESGWLALRLAESLPTGPEQVAACHALGVACYLGKSFDEAIAAYDKGLRIARECTPALNPFQLHLHQAVAECLRITNTRSLGLPVPSLEAFERHLSEAEAMLAQHGDANISLSPAIHWNNQVTLAWARLLRAVWRADAAAAQAELDALAPRAERLARSWLSAAISGAQAELALLQGDVAGALTLAHQMQRGADGFGHVAMVMLSHELLMHLHQLQGDAVAAFEEARRMAARAQQARCESLEGRARLIEWRLELREKKQSVQRLAHQSRTLEQMALHDALTGLPNRRQVDIRLADCLHAAAAPRVCVALIDVDRFKQINDNYSHGVGDAVLKALAGILDHMVRECDLAARLAGDEFVLVLSDADPALARQVCQRIELAVREHGWSEIAPGLAVSISVGVCAAQSGDTVDSVLARSDHFMYEAKRQGRSAH